MYNKLYTQLFKQDNPSPYCPYIQEIPGSVDTENVVIRDPTIAELQEYFAEREQGGEGSDVNG